MKYKINRLILLLIPFVFLVIGMTVQAAPSPLLLRPTPTPSATSGASLTPPQTATKPPRGTPEPTVTGIFTATLTLTSTPPSGRTPTSTPTMTPTATQDLANVPYMEYQIYEGTIHTDLELPPVLPGGQGDYAAIFDKHNLCDLITNGLIDEVWIWAGAGDGITKPHLWEWTTSGPGWTGAAPDCGKVVTTMTFNYLIDVDNALESYNHRLEGAFRAYFPCDFSTKTWPWNGIVVWPECGELLSNQFGFVARPFSENGFIAGCGDAHFPPNITGSQDYMFSDPATFPSICPTWSQDGSATPVPINCEAWGCVHWQYHVWWMQNIPGVNNINRDRDGNLHPNWWSYLFGPPNGSEEPALTTRQVYVIYYPGYGGEPRLEIPILTSELIGLLKKATIYHGYDYSVLQGTFLGQDGASYAGTQCNAGTAPDNVHIRVEGIRTDTPVSSIKLEDIAGGGLWANPCNPVSNWLLYMDSQMEGQVDLYFKPFRIAPDGTIYTLTITHVDGTKETLNVFGSYVEP